MWQQLKKKTSSKSLQYKQCSRTDYASLWSFNRVCVCLSAVSLSQVVRYSVRARLTAAALRHSEQNTHTHTHRCGARGSMYSGFYWPWLVLRAEEPREESLYPSCTISCPTHIHTSTHTHTERLQLFRSSLPVCVLACLCVRVQSETPVVVLKCKCMLEMTNLQQICFTWHRSEAFANARVCICSVACECVTVLTAVVSIVWAGPSAAGRRSFRRMNRCGVVFPPERLERDRQVDRVISCVRRNIRLVKYSIAAHTRGVL